MGWRWMALTLMAASLGGCLLGETPESTYDDMADARKKGGIDSGWIPEWLPASTRAIREVHSIDTNLQVLVFQMAPGQAWTLPDGCQRIAAKDLASMPFSRRWMPDIDEMRQTHEFHRCPATYAGDGWFIARDPTRASVVMWTAWYE